ncbi:MAG: MBOAT family protein [Bacteroidetes bacterium]|nr:MBOAT family protein [Bacteroidota bacterium]MBU1718767.1 MBOAT family protein [Bacteroidota bacterium]
MVFSSSIFLLYFLPAVLGIYYLADQKYKNLVIVAFSLFFFAWGAPVYVFLIIGTMLADFLFSHLIHNAEGRRKRLMLIAAIGLNISMLLYFKYANFFVENINQTLLYFGQQPMKWMEVALPIGISFFTFHEMSYLIDVYRNDKPPMKNITDYAVYILFFPQLIAGPIIRFNEIADQITNRSNNETIDNRIIGFIRFIIGLSKKVLIANVMGQQADYIFALSADELTSGLAWVGVIAYTFQIYFDFSGYSDMAIGLARMIGFVFPENFNNPYISRSITEFWRRWHITLSRWMRDYLYVSLGGNRVKTISRLYFNLIFVFLISGFWHGAAWNFVIWGAFHGLFLILDRLFLLKILEKIGNIPAMMFTFFVTMMGWVFFRVESISQAKLFFSRMFSFRGNLADFNPGSEFWVILVIATLFSFSTAFKPGKKLETLVYTPDYPLKRMVAMTMICSVLFILSIASITSTGFNPFIYFRF